MKTRLQFNYFLPRQKRCLKTKFASMLLSLFNGKVLTPSAAKLKKDFESAWATRKIQIQNDLDNQRKDGWAYGFIDGRILERPM